ncbi:hypothetical protein HK101_009946 [Irineochytrium annulatum]|nr:hypothetical protein HK101_009946 [Irineochytrium annulatum]
MPTISSEQAPLLESQTDARPMPRWKKLLSLRRNPVALLFTIGVVTIGLSLIYVSARPHNNVPERGFPLPKLILARNGAVSSENPICSQVGVDALRDGGSATDAAIAASLCIGVTNMYSSGVGGGGFMLLRDGPTGASEVIDFREAAPRAAFVDMYKDDPRLAQVGGLAVGVPGEIRGFEVAHKRHGKLPWRRLFRDSIKISREGWKVTPVLAKRIAFAKEKILQDPEFSRVFAPGGEILVEGDLIKREKFADTLERMAEEGAHIFYNGSIAESIVKTTQATGGVLTMEDMQDYEAKVVEPLVGYYHGKKVTTAPAPASGAVLLSALNIIEGFDFKTDGHTGLNVHRLVEALKYGYGQRAFYGDPIDPVFRNITEIETNFLDKKLASAIRHNISDERTFEPEHYNPPFDIKEDHGTMHVSVVTAAGDAVTLTSTVNLIFGAQIMDADTGIILNDEMDDFSIPGHPNAFGLMPSPYNYVQPFKRPLSSSVPTIVEDANGKVEIVAGASGGSRIITATLQVILNVLDFGMNIAEAVGEPRLHHQLIPHEVNVEYEFSADLEKELVDRGHKVRHRFWLNSEIELFLQLQFQVTRFPLGLTVTGCEAIHVRKDGMIEGESDSSLSSQYVRLD